MYKTDRKKIRAEIEKRYNENMARKTGLANIRADECLGILHFIDSMQEESINDGLDLGCGVIWKDKEPVNEDLEQAIDTYLATYFGGEKEKQEWPFLKKMAIHFANWQKQKDSIPVSEDLKEAYERYVDERMVLLRPDIADMSCDRDTKMSFDIFDGSEVEAALYEGALWQKQQLMAKAITAHCFGFQGAALFSFRLPSDKYLVGSEVKVIVIKED